MRMKNIGRRQFLMGAGGFSLALPLLPSLRPRSASAGDFPYAVNPRFVAFSTGHGGIWGPNMYPGDEALIGAEMIYPGHQMQYGGLAREVEGSVARLSPVLSAAEDRLTETMVSKLNVIRGLDITFYIGHHNAGHLGNYGRPSIPEDGQSALEYRPTIDQVMAWSPSFYPDIAQIRERSLQIGRPELSWGYSNPGQQQGSVDPLPRAESSLELFNRIFVPDEPSDDTGRTPVVDRVLEHYQAVRTGAFGDARRISAADRQRLDDHMDRLSELQRRLLAKPPASCGDVPTPTEDASYDHPGWDPGAAPPDAWAYYQLFNDVIAAAFICGTSRIATVSIDHIFSEFFGSDWHQEIAHEAHGNAAAQATMVAGHQAFFEGVFLDLAQKLDVEEDNGITVLDNSLLMWSQESGILTHDADSVPIITAGSAAGVFQTGQMLDYRDRTNMALTGDAWTDVVYDKRPGVAYNRWLANVLQAMNVDRSEFERDGAQGYGLTLNENTDAWPERIYQDASEPLPRLWT